MSSHTSPTYTCCENRWIRAFGTNKENVDWFNPDSTVLLDTPGTTVAVVDCCPVGKTTVDGEETGEKTKGGIGPVEACAVWWENRRQNLKIWLCRNLWNSRFRHCSSHNRRRWCSNWRSIDFWAGFCILAINSCCISSIIVCITCCENRRIKAFGTKWEDFQCHHNV